ncbi:MAG: alpha-N-acetylglucosaminidase N-terminal domain-containing protein, partial [Bacteroidaceae bacterium]|nr:alpha-N-acetylglucosaminidase N-terminal domain-containing protein [Bacteroidaceae bacterium]
MKKILPFMMTIVFVFMSCNAKSPAQVSALLDRIGGEGTSERIKTQVNASLSNDGKDVFEISSKKGKPFIQGSSLSALTSGIGWYLNHYAHVNLSWNNLTTDLSDVQLPVPEVVERRECSADYRYYLNYCTYSYSMAFWTKERWEKELDWMALHGINLPLSVVGMDVVWKNVLEEAGYSREDIDNFVAGPGFQAWWLMSNLEGWGGPNPDWWYERQEQLSKFILKRMRELGMEPVLPGYGNILPSNAAEKMGVNAMEQGNWCSGFRRPAFLMPTDARYSEIAQLYYKHLEKVMGKAKFYSMDPFHEGGRTNGINLKEAYYTMYSEMLKHSPEAKWVIQAWGSNPRKEALDTIPKGGFIVLDLYSDGLSKW